MASGYDPDRFDAEIILERSGVSAPYTGDVIAQVLEITRGCLEKRLLRGFYPTPAKPAPNGLAHEWSREQVIDMMLLGAPKPKPVPLKPIAHGTVRGYEMERRRKLPICEACKRAKYDATNARNKARRRERAAA